MSIRPELELILMEINPKTLKKRRQTSGSLAREIMRQSNIYFLPLEIVCGGAVG
jgi:hypothetical protein